MHLGRVAEAEREAVPGDVGDLARATLQPRVDQVPLGEAALEPEHREPAFGDEVAQEAVAQHAELADVMVVLADGDDLGVADQLGDGSYGDGF